MSQSDMLRRAIVRATKEVWHADARGSLLLADMWSRELTALIREYNFLTRAT